MMTTLMAALMVTFSPMAVPEPPDPYGWVCSYLDKAPTLFGVMGLLGEVMDRGMDPARASDDIIDEVNDRCPQHEPLMDELVLVFR